MGGQFLIHTTDDGRARVRCLFRGDTLWLTQAQIAELFETTPQNVTLHLKAIFAEGELVESATCKDYLQVRSEGERHQFGRGELRAGESSLSCMAECATAVRGRCVRKKQRWN